ncbi:alpha/beta hydrolase [Pseudomonas sp. RIT-PI-AD]|uniref:alpha/beta hydrolase n=1 Tax=Pseudomonas sp. RIT-PI-AD TaxID=3035294 RepID=UPI0021D9A839|nr:alpha/beta hydrolase [Pseudomonas sp. RIT-PI-AD]
MKQRSYRTQALYGFAVLGLGTALLTACSHSPDKRPVSEEAVSNAKMMVRADLDMQGVLNAFASLDPKAIENITPTQARLEPTLADAVKKVLRGQDKSTDPSVLVPGVTSTDRSIPGAAGPLQARIYTPQGQGPFPVVVYYHGGGWVIADREVYDAGARGLAKQANAVVVSVDYRRAPENKFPAAHEDALAAYAWVSKHAESLNGDPTRLALAGESAGGNLAVATAIAARDQNMTPPRHVLSVYPVAQNSTSTSSYQKYADAKPLNRPMMLWFIANATQSAADLKDPRIDLVDADLKGLPPVTIINAEIDPLAEDGRMLQSALENAGVKVERKVYEGVTHEFFGAAAVVDKARQAQLYAGQRLKDSLK